MDPLIPQTPFIYLVQPPVRAESSRKTRELTPPAAAVNYSRLTGRLLPDGMPRKQINNPP